LAGFSLNGCLGGQVGGAVVRAKHSRSGAQVGVTGTLAYLNLKNIKFKMIAEYYYNKWYTNIILHFYSISLEFIFALTMFKSEVNKCSV